MNGARISRARTRAGARARVVGVLAAITCTLAAAACSSDPPAAPKGARSTTIAGHHARELGSGTTAVIMIHGATTHKDSWYPLMPHIADAGDWAIAYDYDSSQSADVADIVAYAKQHGATRIVLIGSSLGAQHALEAANGVHAAAVVTFSAEVDHKINEPLLAIASEHDGDTTTFARDNVGTAGKHSKLVVVSGGTHGIDLVHPHPEVMTTVADWLSTVLGN